MALSAAASRPTSVRPGGQDAALLMNAENSRSSDARASAVLSAPGRSTCRTGRSRVWFFMARNPHGGGTRVPHRPTMAGLPCESLIAGCEVPGGLDARARRPGPSIVGSEEDADLHGQA